MIMRLVAEVLIQPVNEHPSARPAWDPQQLNWMKPLDWNCKMRSSEGREFVLEGHFDKPNAFSRGQGAPTRPVTIKIPKPLQFGGSGPELMGWTWHREDRQNSEVRHTTEISKTKMDYNNTDRRVNKQQ